MACDSLRWMSATAEQLEMAHRQIIGTCVVRTARIANRILIGVFSSDIEFRLALRTPRQRFPWRHTSLKIVVARCCLKMHTNQY